MTRLVMDEQKFRARSRKIGLVSMLEALTEEMAEREVKWVALVRLLLWRQAPDSSHEVELGPWSVESLDRYDELYAELMGEDP